MCVCHMLLMYYSAYYYYYYQRCADMYPRIDILRISAILTDTYRIRIVIFLLERIRIRILSRIFYGCALRLNVILFKFNFVYCIH